ncbi:MAG: lipopolysaccharide heptosyltransferase II [Candidatus Gastranaerophilales bacterium]|nr:lipopolysaccharide heptosyltransferase II [Candidatus Gastranaerophilales bacterium]
MVQSIKILIVRLSAIGDVVHSLPVLHALKQKYPNSQIDWVVEDKAADLIVNNPLINKAYVLPRKKWKSQKNKLNTTKEFFNIISEIRVEKYDIAIDLQELFKSAFIMFLSGAKRRIAHDKTREFAHIFANEKLPAHDIFDINKPIIERYLEPANYLGAAVEDVLFSIPLSSNETVEYINKLLADVNFTKPIIIFSPATTWASKHWPENYWAKLADMLCDDNNIIFAGAPNDAALINRIISSSEKKKYISLAGKTSILELLELFKRASVVVAPDTGPAHIANATQIPAIICIFGSTAYKRSGPYGKKHFSLSANLSCQPCFSRQCKLQTNKMECMKQISPQLVYNKIINATNHKG